MKHGNAGKSSSLDTDTETVARHTIRTSVHYVYPRNTRAASTNGGSHYKCRNGSCNGARDWSSKERTSGYDETSSWSKKERNTRDWSGRERTSGCDETSSWSRKERNGGVRKLPEFDSVVLVT